MSGFDYLKHFLENQEYHYESDGSLVNFSRKGVNYFAFDNSSSPYVQIVIICNAKSHSKREMLRVCNEINQGKFIIKFIPRDNGMVWASYEFRPDEHTSSSDFEKILEYLDSITDEFFQKIS